MIYTLQITLILHQCNFQTVLTILPIMPVGGMPKKSPKDPVGPPGVTFGFQGAPRVPFIVTGGRGPPILFC